MVVKFTKEEVLEAISGSFGIVSQVAKNLNGCAWWTARKGINRWEETRLAFESEGERALDVSESQMIKQIAGGDGPMIRFHLMTKGKRRGFTEKIEYSNTSESELDQRIARELAKLAQTHKGKVSVENPANSFED